MNFLTSNLLVSTITDLQFIVTCALVIVAFAQPSGFRPKQIRFVPRRAAALR